MVFKPHDYQRHCIERILEVKKIGLFLDMGLGKTVTTLTAVKELKYNRFRSAGFWSLHLRKLRREPGARKPPNGTTHVCYGWPRYWEARQNGSGR